MKIKKLLLSILACAAVLSTGCSKDPEPDPELTVSPQTTAIIFDAQGIVSYVYTVTTNQSSWSATSNQSWCVVTKNTDGRTFTVTAQANTSTEAPPAATITVSAGKATPITFSATQTAAPQIGVGFTFEGNGTAEADPADAEAGTEVTITATADEHYRFVRWVVETGDLSLADETANPAVFTRPDGPLAIKAEFEVIPNGVVLTDDGHGTAEASPEDAEPGTEMALTATANEHYRFVRWVVETGTLVLADATANPAVFTRPEGELAIKAEFETAINAITMTNDGHGTATASPENAEAGTEVTLTATPTGNYAFKQWVVVSGSGVTFSPDATTSPATFTMPDEAVTIKAEFEKQTDGLTLITDLTFKAYAQYRMTHDEVCDEVTYPLWDTDGDGELSPQEAAAVAYISMNSGFDGTEVASMAGLEQFTGLRKLLCNTNSLTSLDVSGNPALTDLDCSSNSLGSLDVSGNPALTHLNCAGNDLGSLDVSGNPALTFLDCGSNPLGNIDVSQNQALTYLACAGNLLGSLDVSGNPALTFLDCGSNSLTSLDVSGNPALTELGCGDNPLGSLDVSGNPALTLLYCSENSLTSLDVSQNPALTYLGCNGNSLSSLDVSQNPELDTLNCRYNSLGSLDVSGNPALIHLDCSSNSLTSLDMSQNPALKVLYCYSNSLTSLDVSGNPALTELYCHQNSLTSLDVSGNPALTELDCSQNSLTVLDASAMAFNEEMKYTLTCGRQVDGNDDPQTLTLTLRNNQKAYWNSTLASRSANNSVVLAD